MTPEEYLKMNGITPPSETAAKSAFMVSQPLAKSPDEYALSAHMAKSLGLPTPVVDVNYKSLAQKITQKRNETILNGSPKLATWLLENENYRIAADSVEELSWWETAVGATGNAMSRFGMSIPQTGSQYLASEYAQDAADLKRGFGDLIYDSATPFYDPKTGKEIYRDVYDPLAVIQGSWRYLDSRIAGGVAALGLTDDPAQVAAGYQMRAEELRQKIAATPKSPRAQAVTEKVGKISGTWQEQLAQFGQVIAEDPLGFTSFIAETALESVPAIGVSTAVGVATRSPTAAAATMGALSGAREYGSGAGDVVAEAGYDLTTPEGALAAISDEALMRRANEVGQTRAIIIGALDGLSGGLAGKVMSESPVGNMMLQTLTQALFGSGGEAAAQFAAGQELSLADIMIEGIAEAFTAPVEVAGMGITRLREMQAKARDAEGRVAMFTELSGQAVNSKLRARSPDRFREFVEEAASGTPFENVFVPADKFVSYMQSVGIDPYAFVDELDGVTRDDLDAALAGYGGDLKIPTATYAAKIAGGEYDQFLMKNMRFDPMDMDASEAAKFEAAKADYIQEMWAEAEGIRADEERWRSVEDKIHDQVVSSMRVAGLSTERATTEAQAVVAFYRTRAARMGLATEEYLARHPLPGIQGAIPSGMQFKNVDELNRTLAEARNRRAPVAERPAAAALKGRGGIDPSGPLAAELKARGITAKTAPGLFRKGGMMNADNIPMAEAAMMQNRGVDDGNGYVSEQAWVDALEAEARGDAFTEIAAGQSRGDDLDQIEEYLNSLGMDLSNTDEEIRAAIEAAQAEPDRMYGQDGGLKTDSAAFKEWFGDSVVTDADGKPLVVYHHGSFDENADVPNGPMHFGTGQAARERAYGKAKDDAALAVKAYENDEGIWHWDSGSGLTSEDMGAAGFSDAETAIAYGRSQVMRDLDDGGLDLDSADLGNTTGVYLRIENPKRVADVGGANGEWDAVIAQAIAEGHDGIVYRNLFEDKGSDSYIAFAPTQIKSVNNRGTFDANDPRVLFQDAQATDQPLYVVHNLSAEKLRHAAALGGLAAPSLAVARGDLGFDDFGEISLIGAPSLADPKTKGVRLFNADVYSPRQPRARFKVDSKAARALSAVLSPVAERLGLDMRLDGSEIERDGLSAIAGQMVAKAAWLESQGQEVPLVREDVEPKPEPLPGYEGITGQDWYELKTDPAFLNALRANTEGLIARATTPEAQDKVRERFFDADGNLFPDRVSSVAKQVAWRNTSISEWKPTASGKVIRYLTGQKIDKAVGERIGEFNAWVREKFGGVVTDMFFENEAGRKKEYTLANLVREMTRTIRNGENWNYGAGNVRAAVAPEFRSLAEVKAARGQITDKAAMDALKDEVNNELFALADKFAPFVGEAGKGFGWGDNFSEFLRDVAKGPRAVAEWPWAGQVPPELMDEARAFLEKLKGLPTNYFEIKMQRGMEISEFKAALIPSNLADDARKLLTDAGLELVEYQEGDDGDDGGVARNAALQQIGPKVFFQDTQGPRGQISFNMDRSSLIQLFESANLSTVQHELGHLFLTMMQRDAASGDAGSVAEYEVIKGWWRDNAAAVASDGNRAMPDAKLTAEDVQRAIDTGSTGDVVKDAAVDVGMQEQWARGYEAYLMEGKPPSVELRSAFEKFRSWMLSVYKSLVGLNVKINDDIRGVFDRMLATDEEIAKAKQAKGDTAPVFSTAEQMGLTADEFDRLMKLRVQSEDEAKARLQAEIMGPIRRETEKEYMAEKAKVTETVTERLRRMPVFRAVQEMRFGKTFEGDETPGVKLDRGAIEDQYGAGYIPFLPGATKDGKGHKNAVFAPEGMHPDVAAGMYGFTTGRELLDAMANAPEIGAAIKAEVERTMYELHGDPLKDGEIERMALEAMHTDKRGEWLAAELKAVSGVAGVDVAMTMKEARASARQTVGQMKVKDATAAMRFLAAERKAGEEAARLGAMLAREGVWMQNARRRIATKAKAALRDAGTVGAVAGQIDQANASTGNYNETVQRLIDAKRRQLMNHAMFMEATKQRATVEKTADRLAKLNRSDKRLSGSMTVDHVKAARAIAAKFGLARAETAFDFNAWMEQLAFDDPIRAAALAEAIEIWGQADRNYRDLTVNEFGAMVDSIDNVLETGKRFSGIETAGRRVERDQVVAELTAVFDERGYADNEAMAGGLKGLKKIMHDAKTLTSSSRAMLRVMETWARTMDNGEQGPFTNYIVRPVMDALGQYFENRQQKMADLLAIVDGAKSKLNGNAIPAPELRGQGKQPYAFQNKAALLHAILHTGNESNKAKLLIGWGFSDGFVNQAQALTALGKPRAKKDGSPILTKGELDTVRWDAFLDRMIREGVITSADIDLVNSIWDVFEGTKRPAQSTHKKLKGFYFKEIENSPYQTAAGLLKGGHVPAMIDKEASLDAGRQGDMRALDQNSTSMFPTTGAGFTKSRVENYREPLELNLMLLPSHLDDVLRFTYLEPAIQQTASLVSGRDMRDTMQRADPNLVGDTIMPWLQRTASRSLDTGTGTAGRRRWGRVFDRMRSRIGISIMFMNVVNTAQQITGPIVAASEVSPRRLGRALVRMVSGDAPAMRKAIEDASPYMKERLRLVANDSQIALRDLVQDKGVFTEVDKFTQKHGYVLQSAFQSVLDVPVWTAAYDQAVSNGLDRDAAIFEADSAVRRFMPDSAPENVTAFAQGAVTWRLITMFTSFFIAQANLLGGRMGVIRRTMGWKGAPQAFWAYLTIFALPAIVAQAIADAASGGGPEDEDDDGMMDELLAWFGITQLRYGAAMVPFAGQAVLKTISAFNDNPVDDRLSVSPVVSAVETATRAGSSIYGAATDDASARRATIDGLQVISLITGIPTGQLGRVLGYGVGVSEGRYDPAGTVDVMQGVIAGRDGTER